MKNLRFTSILAFIAILTLTFTSCEKDEDSSSASYIGTWVNEEEYTFGDETIVFSTTLVFSASSFSMTATETSEGETETLIGMSGSLSTSGNFLTITPTSIGAPDLETGEMVWVNDGDDGWDEAILDIEMEGGSDTVEYSVDGNTLTLIFDEDDTEEYTKQ